MDIDALWRLIADKAIPGGAQQIELTSYTWDVGAFCDDPVSVTHHARRDDRHRRNEKWQTNPGSLTLHMQGLPCRKCARCLQVRSAEWSRRMQAESETWRRTWFGTFTFRPEVHHAMLMSVLAEKNRRGWNDADFSGADEYNLRCEEVGRQMTLFFKKVRKDRRDEKPLDLRYVWVTEQHKSGLPHVHALIHEVAGDVTYRRLASRWNRGFLKLNLIDNPKTASRYVAKYITKTQSRLRASLHYGEPSVYLENALKRIG